MIFCSVNDMSRIVMPLTKVPISKRSDDHIADAALAAAQPDAADHDDKNDVVDHRRIREPCVHAADRRSEQQTGDERDDSRIVYCKTIIGRTGMPAIRAAERIVAHRVEEAADLGESQQKEHEQRDHRRPNDGSRECRRHNQRRVA